MRKLTPNQTKKLDRYLAAIRAKKSAEAEIQAAKDDAQAIVANRGGSLTHDSARLTVEEAVRYDYSDAIKQAKSELTARQKQEVEDGTATPIVAEKLVCRDAK